MSNTNKATGPLRVSPVNSRYFEDSSRGKIVYVTGTHTWNNFQDRGSTRPRFDYDAYLDFLTEHHMNFMRLWVSEHPRWGPWSSGDDVVNEPMPYSRTGPGKALDGQPQFDLDGWNQEYFDRLAQRVEKAYNRGVYVDVMIFSGCSIGNRDWPEKDHETGEPVKNPWDSHPFNKCNNINGLDGDLDGDGQGWDLRDVKRADILERQKALIRKMIDAINHYDNVLYEIANEDPFDTWEWQYAMINYIKEYEAAKPKQHPVGMTASWKQPNDVMYQSPADWISPYYNEDEALSPMTAPGGKVWVADTDHVFPNVGATMDFTWKAFLRGANIISMDNFKTGAAWAYFYKRAGGNVTRYEQEKIGRLSENDFSATIGDLAQKHTKMFAERMNLARAVPHNELSSTGYCLADPGREYLIYQPNLTWITVDLAGAAGEFAVEWLNPVTGEVKRDGTMPGGDKNQKFILPFETAILYLRIKD